MREYGFIALYVGWVFTVVALLVGIGFLAWTFPMHYCLACYGVSFGMIMSRAQIPYAETWWGSIVSFLCAPLLPLVFGVLACFPIIM